MKKQSKSKYKILLRWEEMHKLRKAGIAIKSPSPFFHYLSKWSLPIKVEEHRWGKEVELDA